MKVAIRVRPFIEKERHENTCIDTRSDFELIIGGDRSFKYDRVFREDSPQVAVYEQCIRELVLSCFDGYNAAVLAYGQTGSISCASQAARHSPWVLRPPTSQTCPASESSPGLSTTSSVRWSSDARRAA